eukprot:SAG11_NODE_16857_length_535_cov_0.931193_1_plen_65_part_00
MRRYTFGSGGLWRDDTTFWGFFVDLCGVVILVKGIMCILLWLGKETCASSPPVMNTARVYFKHS